MRLKNKAIIVTGSTTGIGRAIATRFVEEGARVLVHGRDEERGRSLAEALGERAVFHRENLADPEAPLRLVEAALSSFGSLDGLVNNAAFVVRSDLHTTTPELFDRVIAVNLKAPLLLIRAALEHLRSSRGCILNIGSINAHCGEEALLAYSISKGGLMTLSRNLGDSLHYHYGVRVNHFNVGWVLTDNEYRYKMEDGLPADWPERLPKSVNPSGRLIRPEGIATAAVYWMSDESRPISGSVLELEQYPVIGRNPPKEVD